MFNIKLELMNQFSKTLSTDKIDVVILNLPKMPRFKFIVIKEVKLTYEG